MALNNLRNLQRQRQAQAAKRAKANRVNRKARQARNANRPTPISSKSNLDSSKSIHNTQSLSGAGVKKVGTKPPSSTGTSTPKRTPITSSPTGGRTSENFSGTGTGAGDFGTDISGGTGGFSGNPILDPRYQLQGAGNPVFRSAEELDEAVRIINSGSADIPDRFIFSQEQLESARRSLEAGGRGVDPLGFGGLGAGEQRIGIPQRDFESQGRDEAGRLPVDTPLSPEAGVRGPGTGTGQTVQIGGESIQVQGTQGEIEKNAFQRLTEAGHSPDEALKIIEESRPAIQEAASKTGLGEDLEAGFTAGQKLDPREKRKEELRRRIAAGSEPLPEDMKATPAEKRDIEQARDFSSALAADELASLEKADQARAQGQREQDKARAEILKNIKETREDSPQQQQLSDDLTALQGDVNGLMTLAQSDPLLFQATASKLFGIQDNIQSINNSIAQFRNEQPTDAELESPLGDIPRLLRQEQREKDLLLEAKEVREENVKITQDMNMAQQELLEMKNDQQERRLMEDNLEAEKRLRTRMARLGIATDTGALDYFQGKLRQMGEDLTNLQNANSIEELIGNINLQRQSHNDLRQIANDYDTGRLEISKAYADAIGDIRSSVTKSKADKDTEYAKEKLKASLKIGELWKDRGDAISDANKDLWTRMFDEKKQRRLNRNDLVSEAFRYITAFGTQSTESRSQLRGYERQLGLEPGSLTENLTLAEKRLRKAAGSGVDNALSLVQQERERVRKRWSTATDGDIENYVLTSLLSRYDGKMALAIEEAMIQNPVGDGDYILEPVFGTADGSKKNKDLQFDMEERRALDSREIDPNDLYRELTTIPDSKGDKMSPEEAILYLEKRNIFRVDKRGKPEFASPTPREDDSE